MFFRFQELEMQYIGNSHSGYCTLKFFSNFIFHKTLRSGCAALQPNHETHPTIPLHQFTLTHLARGRADDARSGNSPAQGSGDLSNMLRSPGWLRLSRGEQSIPRWESPPPSFQLKSKSPHCMSCPRLHDSDNLAPGETTKMKSEQGVPLVCIKTIRG